MILVFEKDHKEERSVEENHKERLPGDAIVV